MFDSNNLSVDMIDDTCFNFKCLKLKGDPDMPSSSPVDDRFYMEKFQPWLRVLTEQSRDKN